MKKILLITGIIVVVIFFMKKCRSSEDGVNTNDTSIAGYIGTVQEINGNVLTLVSGLNARLLGVEANRTDVEMFLRSQYLGKDVILYPDSHSYNTIIVNPTDTVDVYAIERGTRGYSVNRIVVNEYPDSYRELETFDSTGWVPRRNNPVEKKNLALYMKQRTFLIQTPEGIGTGFFINKHGLAVTNWHVLAPGQERNSIAILYEDNPDDSQVYADKKRNFKNILWSEDIKGLDLTIVSVDLEHGEEVPYFDIVSRRPNQGDRVATYGNPRGLTASFSQGAVSAFRKDPLNPGRNVDMVQYDMPTNGGNSGGPVCDIYGRIIAIHELGDKSAQNINYGIDALQLRQVLDGRNLQYGGK